MRPLSITAAALAAASLLACDAGEVKPVAQPPGSAAPAPTLVDGVFTEAELRRVLALSPAEVAPPADETNAVAADRRAQRLGQFLFHDTRLSSTGETSCASCHRPDHGFSTPDRLSSDGAGTTGRHPPSVLNVAYQPWYDWDGKASTLWNQATRPLESPDEQDVSRVEVVRHVAEDPELSAAYETIFGPLPTVDEQTEPEAIDRAFTNITKAIAAYEMQLVDVGTSPFDTYVAGLRDDDPKKREAISREAKLGLKLFVGKAGCVNCHNGPTLSDGAFHNLGLPARSWMKADDRGRFDGVPFALADPLASTGPYSDAPKGARATWLRFLTQTPEDQGQFKTPTLRNVAKTPPYMHGGHFATLEEVVDFYNVLGEPVTIGHREEVLEPLGLSAAGRKALVAFLKTLDGAPLPDELLAQPDSPLLEDSAAETTD